MRNLLFASLAAALALPAAAALPVRAGEVAMETLTIQHEGMAKSGHDGRYILTAPTHGPSSEVAKQTQDGKAAGGDPDRPVILGSPPNPSAGKKTADGAAKGSGSPSKVNSIKTKPKPVQAKGNTVPRYHIEQAWPKKVN